MGSAQNTGGRQQSTAASHPESLKPGDPKASSSSGLNHCYTRCRQPQPERRRAHRARSRSWRGRGLIKAGHDPIILGLLFTWALASGLGTHPSFLKDLWRFPAPWLPAVLCCVSESVCASPAAAEADDKHCRALVGRRPARLRHAKQAGSGQSVRNTQAEEPGFWAAGPPGPGTGQCGELCPDTPAAAPQPLPSLC